MRRMAMLVIAAALLLAACQSSEPEMRVIPWGPVLSYMTEEEILAEFERRTEMSSADYMADYGGLYLDSGRAVVLFRGDSDALRIAQAALTDDVSFRVAAVKYTDAQLDAVKEWLGGIFPFLGEYVMRESGLNVQENCIDIGVEAGTDIAAFTAALTAELAMPDVGADIFNVYEFDPADEVSYLTGP